MYFSSLHGQGTSSSPSASGAPTECRQGTNSPSSPSTSIAGCPIRVMIRIDTATYGESVSCTPTCAIGEPSGPIENGTTYIVRPRIEPLNSSVRVSRISSGSRQLLVGPASSSSSEQMKVRSSTRATSFGFERARYEFGPLRVGEPLEGSGVHELLARARRTPPPIRRTSAPFPAGSARPPARPRRAASGGWLARRWRSSRACASPYLRQMRQISLSSARPRLRRVRAALRFVASVMMVSGTLLIADAAVTLLWQEPVSAYVAGKNQGTLKQAFFDPPQRVIHRRPLKGDAIAQITIPSIGAEQVRGRGHGRGQPPQGPRALSRDAAARGARHHRDRRPPAPPTARRSGTSTR